MADANVLDCDCIVFVLTLQTSDLGLRRQLVIDAILSRSRCAYACAYYLVIHRYGRKRLLAASEQLAAHGADKT